MYVAPSANALKTCLSRKRILCPRTKRPARSIAKYMASPKHLLRLKNGLKIPDNANILWKSYHPRQIPNYKDFMMSITVQPGEFSLPFTRGSQIRTIISALGCQYTTCKNQPTVFRLCTHKRHFPVVLLGVYPFDVTGPSHRFPNKLPWK